MKKLFSSAAIIVLFSVAALADIRLETPTPKAEKTPKQAKSIETTLSVSLRRDAKEARLIIPKSQIKQLRAELEQLDDDAANTSASLNFTKTQTVVSGLFLSLALVFGGVWLARSGKNASKTGKVLVIGAILFSTGAFAAVAFGNIGPPIEARSITGKIFSDAVHQYKQASGAITVETSDTADHIQLIVPDAPGEKSE